MLVVDRVGRPSQPAKTTLGGLNPPSYSPTKHYSMDLLWVLEEGENHLLVVDCNIVGTMVYGFQWR